MKGNTREVFKNIYEAEFAELKNLAAKAAKEHNCIIELEAKKILIKAENPFNSSGTICYRLRYTSNIIDEIHSIFNELDGKLQTLYKPLYVAMMPTIILSLNDVVAKLTCAKDQVELVYKDDREASTFKYTAPEYERFVDHIMDMIKTTDSKLSIPTTSKLCKDHEEHCGECGNTNCQHNLSLIKSLWHNMDPEAQKRVKDSPDPTKLAELEKAVGYTDLIMHT